MGTEVTPALVELALSNSTDKRVPTLADGNIPALASLLAPHIDGKHGEFELRYLAPGKSGAFVVLVVFSDALSRVIKVGPKHLIEQEIRNYADFDLLNRIPSEFILQFVTSPFAIGDRASVAFHWAGGYSGVATFRESLFKLQASAVERLLSELAHNIFRWQKPRHSASSPIDQFKWQAEARARIVEVLRSLANSELTSALVNFLEDDSTLRNLIQQKTCSLGLTHGDLHGGNILVPGDSLSPTHLRVIDFASVQPETCPARDWAKLERDVRFRCRRAKAEIPLKSYLAELDGTASDFDDENSDLRTARAAVATIRDRYREYCFNASGEWEFEYLYCLLCWSLNELHSNPEISTTEDRIAVATSCAAIYESLCRHSASLSGRAPTKRRHEIDSSVKAFLADTRIAGYVEREDGSERPLYLDHGLYVPRQAAEEQIDAIIEQYANDSLGRWVSISGDAGHGKTSLMWRTAAAYVDGQLGLRAILCQQLGANALADLAKLLEAATGYPTIVLLDTLDLLVGIDDAALGSALNKGRSSGLLIISTSRRQEAQQLAKFVQWNESVDLTRFSPEEAKLAVTRYVDAVYPDWSEGRRAVQFSMVWEILDHQRQFQDLTFEPLILRMIFQAYVPNEIPRDVNTQRVYDKFWEARVLYDRSVKTPSDSFKRAQACELLADFIAFREGKQTDTATTGEAEKILRIVGNQNPFETIDSLISSGAMRSARGKSAVAFFHQTFFEYAAARAVLYSEDERTRNTRIEWLLKDLRESRLFRLPVLKQLAIQAYFAKDRIWPFLAAKIEVSGNQAAAKIALEVIGKIGRDEEFVERVLQWAERETNLFQTVTPDIVRSYPAARFDVAFRLLESQLRGERERDIYFIVEKNFAPLAPAQTLEFLRKATDRVRDSDHETNALFRHALMAVLREGQAEALAVLAGVFYRFGNGLQDAVLQEVSELITAENAELVANLLSTAADPVIERRKKLVPKSFFDLLRSLHVNFPALAEAVVSNIVRRCADTTDLDVAILSSKSRGTLRPTDEQLANALDALASADHLVRLSTSEFLGELARHHGDELLEAILAKAGSPVWERKDATKSLLLTLRNVRMSDPLRLLKVLDHWPFPERGAGIAFRAIFEQLVRADAAAAREWLLKDVVGTRSEADVRKIMIGVQLVSEVSPLVMSDQDVKRFIEFGMHHQFASFDTRRIACAALAGFYPVTPDYCAKTIEKVFATGTPEWVSAIVGALKSKTWTGLPLLVMRMILAKRANRTRDLFLGSFLKATAGLPLLAKVDILEELSNWTSTVLPTVREESTLLEILILAKSTAQYDPKKALAVAKSLKIASPATLGNLCSVYENITFVSSDAAIHRQALDELIQIAHHRQHFIRNSLRRILPRVEGVLGPRVAVDAIKAAVKSNPKWEEKALEELMQAAILIPSWTSADSEELRALPLPRSVSAILLHFK